MSNAMDALAEVLFNKPTLQECSLQQVDYLAQQYPYFNVAQLLLLKKTEATDERYAQQLQRTVLQFSNPLQLESWLQPHVETKAPEPQLFQKPIPDEIEAISNEPETAVAAPVEEMEQPEQPTPSAPLSEVKDTATEKEPEEKQQAEPLAFEPYHTVDYFASQGIKLSLQEPVATDQLGKGLKSFTEWLKTMKRLPVATPQNQDAAGEHKVENLAAHSLDAADVVTESMAEVWLKQGATEKAVDVYNKLRLRNPAKSAYFAAKIESLKHT